MKLVTKKSKAKPKVKAKTLAEVERGLQTIEKQLELECSKCDGTGKPKTKNGEPPKSGHGDAKCGTCRGTGIIGSKLDVIEDIKQELKKIKSNLDAYINKQSVEIRVLPEGHNPDKHGGTSKEKWENGWEDYTGRFDLDDQEVESIVVGKAMGHFETYLKNGVYHRNKKLGVFLSNKRSGRQLIEEIETGD